MNDSPERRELSFGTLDEAVSDAEQVAAGAVKTTGNYSFAEILRHLALSHDMATGKITAPRPPWFMRLFMPLMKNFILNRPLGPGFKLPPAMEEIFWPRTPIELEPALEYFKESVEHYKLKGPLKKHPMFGAISREQNDRLNCAHCALHLSFVHPAS
ncbi:MAG: DUF1569 domain-containing protein [Planctomycetota bacterium]